MKKILLVMFSLFFAAQINAQTADEILDNYFENIGGRDAMDGLSGIKMMAKVSQGGMEIPIEIVQLKDGRQYTKFQLQGIEFFQGVFDGETLWNSNFQTQKAEKADAETTENMKRNIGAFPDPFLNYTDKGYSVELLGTETVEGTETFKLKLTQKPVLVDGEEMENITFYYFDSENFVPIMVEKEMMAGPMKGNISVSRMSDYQEVEGLYFPFSLSQGVKGGGSQPLMIESISLNPEVEETMFKFPEEN